MPHAKVELQIQPPLSYEITKQAGGLKMEEEILEGETLGELLVRLVRQNPPAFQHVYDSDIKEILPPIVTVVNGTTMPRADAIARKLADGDKITWLLMYAGG